MIINLNKCMNLDLLVHICANFLWETRVLSDRQFLSPAQLMGAHPTKFYSWTGMLSKCDLKPNIDFRSNDLMFSKDDFAPKHHPQTVAITIAPLFLWGKLLINACSCIYQDGCRCSESDVWRMGVFQKRTLAAHPSFHTLTPIVPLVQRTLELVSAGTYHSSNCHLRLECLPGYSSLMKLDQAGVTWCGDSCFSNSPILTTLILCH